jgi:hypothetical protein
MSPLLVFNRVYRLEIQSVMLVFSTPLVNYSAPLTFSLVHLLVYWCKGCLNIPVLYCKQKELGQNIKSTFFIPVTTYHSFLILYVKFVNIPLFFQLFLNQSLAKK